MKQFISIFTLSVFFLAQFGKLMNFGLCLVSTYQQTKTFDCDCEKQLIPELHNNYGGSKQPVQALASLPQLDELFATHYFEQAPTHTFIISAPRIKIDQEALYNVYRSNIFHPPSLAA